MLVYGDAVRREPVREKLARLDAMAGRVRALPPGIVRHGELVALFVEASELAQGLADRGFEARGRIDARSPVDDAAMAVLLALARSVQRSWKSGFADIGELPEALLDPLRASALPDAIETKLAEGYAFYALYPEAYLDAAATLPRDAPARVIGIRSIGIGLAALVATAAGAPAPITVRPVGHPFRRELALAPALAGELVEAGGAARYAIVDEGPGLSGSSFGAVGDDLEDRGVPRDRLHFFPSHGGDLGAEAQPRHRERWREVHRHTLGFEALAREAREPAHRLTSWLRNLTGATVEPLRDLSGGAWRAEHRQDESRWPPAAAHQERRKFLVRGEAGDTLVKFAGLGREGQRKAERAGLLSEAGFSPESLGWRHGFLVERWEGGGTPLDRLTVDRGVLLSALGAYLAFRARHFGAEPDRGASLDGLLRMARHNIGEVLGADMAEGVLGRWEGEAPRLSGLVRRVETDNRLHPWEWLVRPDGRLLKTDAVDHHATHDLIGCQDIAWDIAGAAVEFALAESEREVLCAAVEREAGRSVSPELLALSEPCYLAFQLGAATMAAQALAGWPEEAARLRRAADRYTRRVVALQRRSGVASNRRRCSSTA